MTRTDKAVRIVLAAIVVVAIFGSWYLHAYKGYSLDLVGI